MASTATKIELRDRYRQLAQLEQEWQDRPSEEVARRISVVNAELASVNQRASEEHEVALEEAELPEDKAHHLMHVLGYYDMSDRHDDEAEAWENVGDSIAGGTVGQEEEVSPLPETESPIDTLRVRPLGSGE